MRNLQIVCIFAVRLAGVSASMAAIGKHRKSRRHLWIGGLTFIVSMLVCVCPCRALDIDYQATARIGWIMPDGKTDKVVGQPGRWYGPTWGADISVAFHPDWHSLQQWNNAAVGVGLSYWNMSHDLLGHAIAPYIYMDIPIVKCPHFELGLRPGIGAAFMTKTYTNTIAEGHKYQDVAGANECIGSVSNFYFPEAIYINIPIANGWGVVADGGWYHISNGSIRQPNSGYNMFAAAVGVRWVSRDGIGTGEEAQNETEGQTKKWRIEAAFTGGGRQVYYRDQQTFFVGEMQIAAYWLAHPIFRLGGGVDVFYDGAYIPRETKFGKTNLAAARPSDCWRVGISVQPEFVVGNFTAGLHIGAYMYDPVKELEPYQEAKETASGRLVKPIFYAYDLLKAGSAGYPDGWLYTQVVLRYRLPWHIFMQGTMKSHLTKVEFMSVGLGVYW